MSSGTHTHWCTALLAQLFIHSEGQRRLFNVTCHQRAACQGVQRQRWRGRGGRWGRWWTSWSSSERRPGFSETPSTWIVTQYHICVSILFKLWKMLHKYTYKYKYKYIRYQKASSSQHSISYNVTKMTDLTLLPSFSQQSNVSCKYHETSQQMAESAEGCGTNLVILKILSRRRARRTLMPKEVPGLKKPHRTSKMLPTITCSDITFKRNLW